MCCPCFLRLLAPSHIPPGIITHTYCNRQVSSPCRCICYTRGTRSEFLSPFSLGTSDTSSSYSPWAGLQLLGLWGRDAWVERRPGKELSVRLRWWFLQPSQPRRRPPCRVCAPFVWWTESLESFPAPVGTPSACSACPASSQGGSLSISRRRCRKRRR